MARDQRPPGRIAPTLAVVALLLSVGTTAPAQDVATYVSLVEQYSHGDATAAVMELARWSGERITGAIDQWRRQLTIDQLRAAAMMHTDLAYILMADGQPSSALIEIRNAERLVTVMIADSHGMESTRAFAIRWYAFTTSVYTAQGRLDAAERFVRSGLATFPRAAELYVARGSIAEMRASLEDDDLARALYGGAGKITRGIARLWESAAADYRRALDLDDTMAPAHLHLGWVHHLIGDKRASRDLDMALIGATDDSVRYLAHLFLGAVAERRNNLETARREFDAAKAVGPYQSSYVALGRIEVLLGHGERARALAWEYAELTQKFDDPWWDYRLGGFNADALSWLHREARRQ